jgi:2-oxoglutarate ferredoxin oxidoreductase subunit alpha
LAARSALSVVEQLRSRGERIGLLELQTLWPFPAQLVRDYAKDKEYVGVVEMNMGQLINSVKLSVDNPRRVYLINRVDGRLITDKDIKQTLRVIEGQGV